MKKIFMFMKKNISFHENNSPLSIFWYFTNVSWLRLAIYNSGLLALITWLSNSTNKPENIYPNARIRSKSFSSPTTHRTSPACRQREGVMSVRFCWPSSTPTTMQLYSSRIPLSLRVFPMKGLVLEMGKAWHATNATDDHRPDQVHRSHQPTHSKSLHHVLVDSAHSYHHVRTKVIHK